MLRQIKRDEVRLGMFIHAFEGSWFDHPFWRSRFRLTNAEDLVRIQDSAVRGVVIDECLGVPLNVAAPAADLPPVLPEPPVLAPERRLPVELLAEQRQTSFAEEKEKAAQVVRKATAEMKRLFGSAHRGQTFSLTDITPLVCDIMISVSRNPQALVALTRLKRRDEYTYVHSIAVSALMTRLARGLGMGEDEVFELSVAGLLHDIGKMIVPDEVLNKPGSLTDEEFALVRTHPEQGHAILWSIPDMPGVVLDVCQHHHERLDGTGYPFRLKAEAISTAARVAAICDVFDALTSNRAYKPAWTAEEAVTRMAEWSGHFDRALLFTFMRTLGVFPPGLLVRLRSNRLAVTMPNGRRASRPKVRVFYCTRDHVPLPLEDAVLDDNLACDQVMGEEYPLDWGFVSWSEVADQLLKGVAPKLPSVRVDAAVAGGTAMLGSAAGGRLWPAGQAIRSGRQIRNV